MPYKFRLRLNVAACGSIRGFNRQTSLEVALNCSLLAPRFAPWPGFSCAAPAVDLPGLCGTEFLVVASFLTQRRLLRVMTTHGIDFGGEVGRRQSGIAAVPRQEDIASGSASLDTMNMVRPQDDHGIGADLLQVPSEQVSMICLTYPCQAQPRPVSMLPLTTMAIPQAGARGVRDAACDRGLEVSARLPNGFTLEYGAIAGRGAPDHSCRGCGEVRRQAPD